MKKVLCFLVCFCLLLNLSFVCFAADYKFPNSFWPINEAYVAALESGNNEDIIKYGEETIGLMVREAENEQTIDVLATRHLETAKAYANLGMYDKSANAYKNFIPYAEKTGKMSEEIKTAKACILQFDSDVKVYVDKGEGIYYGAKNEHENGILFGACADGKIRDKLSNESMVLLYHELGHTITDWQRMIMTKADESDLAVEFALNCKNEGWDIDNINEYNANLAEIAAFLNNYPNMKVFLRFAAEFDVWTTMPEPQSFINAYRYVSDYFKQNCKNVAMVWSPNQVSGFYTNVDDYYPGDEYVDWVGMSSYYQPYFQGNKNVEDKYQEIFFKTGINSEPYLAVKNIVEKYGDRKPIMISESGFSHYVNTIGEDTTTFALERMEDFYAYLPIMYPQIKLIAYFDKTFDHESDNFSLLQNSALEQNYLKYTKNPRFIQDSENNTSPVYYSELYQDMTLSNLVNLYTYSHIYGERISYVEYYVDSQFITSSNKAPYIATIDLSNFENGRHSIVAKSYTASGSVYGKETIVNVQNEQTDEINVVVNGNKLSFDAPAFIYNNRTFVPLRAIFEALNAKVDWEEATQTITSYKGDTTVKCAISDYMLYKNSEEIILDASPMLVSQRTFVPVRAIAQSFGCEVLWDGETNTVTISEK